MVCCVLVKVSIHILFFNFCIKVNRLILFCVEFSEWILLVTIIMALWQFQIKILRQTNLLIRVEAKKAAVGIIKMFNSTMKSLNLMEETDKYKSLDELSIEELHVMLCKFLWLFRKKTVPPTCFLFKHSLSVFGQTLQNERRKSSGQ